MAGGVNTQLYWHTTAPSYARSKYSGEPVYVSLDRVDAFVSSFVAFSHGVSSLMNARARAKSEDRRNLSASEDRIESQVDRDGYDGHLPYPYGRETTDMK